MVHSTPCQLLTDRGRYLLAQVDDFALLKVQTNYCSKQSNTESNKWPDRVAQQNTYRHACNIRLQKPSGLGRYHTLHYIRLQFFPLFYRSWRHKRPRSPDMMSATTLKTLAQALWFFCRSLLAALDCVRSSCPPLLEFTALSMLSPTKLCLWCLRHRLDPRHLSSFP